MSTQIFVNLAVKDLAASVAFYRALGYDLNAAFTNDKAACLVISDTIHVMLLTEPFFLSFTSRQICDTATHLETQLALSAESRAAVAGLVARAVAAGGTTPRPPQDLGFMYSQAFLDLDGHLWEPFWMDPQAATEGSAA
jgi:uncharacterized protein